VKEPKVLQQCCPLAQQRLTPQQNWPLGQQMALPPEPQTGPLAQQVLGLP
jgi:hypothetical protein